MRKILFLCFLLSHTISYAHSDVTYSINKNNLHFSYRSSWEEFEFHGKVDIFLILAEKLLKERGYDKPIYIYFQHGYFEDDTSYYALGYGPFTFMDYETSDLSKMVEATGLKVQISDKKDFRIPELLNLMNWAITHVEYIKDKQADYYIKSRHFELDTVRSIPFAEAFRQLSATDSIVKKYLQEKTFPVSKPSLRPDGTYERAGKSIRYYFQKNKFHFYRDRREKDLLLTDDVHEIIGNPEDGHFIFTNDSMFYYITAFQNKVMGPFLIDSMEPGRGPVKELIP